MNRQLSPRHRSSRTCTIEPLEGRRLLAATISGAVMQDITGNGLTADDKPLAGVTVKLYKDVNANGKLDATDGAAIATKISAASTGAFSFTGLTTGKYIVQDVAGSLKDAVVGADVFIGVSAPNVLSGPDIEAMADGAIVFALANPVPEVDPGEARRYATVVATGR